MSLTPGTRLGVYEVTSQIGEGGMGQVYRATDTKLKRQVAIKILPPSLAGDHDRLARFQREAEVLASLNHPHIAAIYGLDESGGMTALVMELVEGEDLSRRIARGAIPLDEALPIAKQIAEALEAAHEQGIIHRDLKPANIKVRTDGTVKVLDFGLAKALDTTAASSPTVTQSPTITTPGMMTGIGMILGTAAYMSPEQAKGRPADKRSDIWAFGCVLYEMLTGKRAFEGEDVSDTLANVLKTDPDWGALPADVPRAVRTLLRLCLAKDVRERRRDAGDVRVDLGQSAAGEHDKFPSLPVVQKRGGHLAGIAAMCLALITVVLMGLLLRPAREPAEMRVDITTPSTIHPLMFALSPDGGSLAFVASGAGPSRLWVRQLSGADAQPLIGTDDATYPFWSPDSRSIGFFAGGKLKRVDVSGGQPTVLADAQEGMGGAWSADGRILFAPTGLGNGLFAVGASGGKVVPATQLEPQQSTHRFPSFMADGRHFLFVAGGAGGGSDHRGIYLASLDGGSPTRLAGELSRVAFLRPDRVVFARDRELVAQSLDLKAAALIGEPQRLASAVSVDPLQRYAAFSTDRNDRLVFRAGSLERQQLAWFDRSGKRLGAIGVPDENVLHSPELAPDGRRVAVDRRVGNNRDVWLIDVRDGGMTRFTFDAANDGYPVWSPDGTQVAFESDRNNRRYHIFLKPSNGSTQEELLLERPGDQWPLDWSKDSKFLLYLNTASANTQTELWALPMTGRGRQPFVVAHSPVQQVRGAFSPDARWVSYDTNESGRFEVVVQPFPSLTGKWQVSSAGGTAPRWSANGKELYFVSSDGFLMAAEVRPSASSFEFSAPIRLFQARMVTGAAAGPKPQYVVAPDGRFLINEIVDESTATPITLVLNWKPSQ